MILAFSFSLLVSATAQEKKIQTDRPGETQTSGTTGKRFFQLEIGFEKEQQKNDDYSVLHPQANVKYGLSERFELRAEITAETNKQFIIFFLFFRNGGRWFC